RLDRPFGISMFPTRFFLRACLALTLASCLYDPHERCDKNQRFDSATGVCLCTDNTIPREHGCDLCPEHEVAQGSWCACESGYARQAAGGACALLPRALGSDCDPAVGSCDAAFPTCHPLAAGGGYCTTSGCASNDDCSGG